MRTETHFDRDVNVQPDPWHNMSLAERRDAFKTEITMYCGEVRIAESLRREELAQLEGLQRHVALSKSLIPNMIRHYRLHKNSTCAPGLLVMITLLCDNNDGICRVGVRRFAELFDRDERSITRAIEMLESDGLLYVNRNPGLPNSYWPSVPAVLAKANASVGWFVDALSTKPAPSGRRHGWSQAEHNEATVEPEYKPPTPVSGVYSDAPPTQMSGVYDDFLCKPPTPVSQTPDASALHISLSNISKDSSFKRESAFVSKEREVQFEHNPNGNSAEIEEIPRGQERVLKANGGRGRKPAGLDLGPVPDAVPPAKRARKAPATPIPDDLSEALGMAAIQYARQQGHTDAAIIEMLEEFRLYYKKTGKLYVDWMACWQGWVRRQKDFKRSGLTSRPGARASMDDLMAQAFSTPTGE